MDEPNSALQIRSYIKILHLQGDSFVPITTLRAPWTTVAERSRIKLQDLHTYLKAFTHSDYGFCLNDKSFVADETSVDDYLPQNAHKPGETIKTPVEPQAARSEVHNHIYIKDRVRPLDTGELLRGQFVIKLIDKSFENEQHGSIYSSQLSTAAQPLTLAMLRQYVKTPGSQIDSFEFCFEDKTIAHDSMPLETYIGRTTRPEEVKVDLPMISVFIQRNPRSKVEVLRKGFLIRFVKKGSAATTDESDTSEGSVQSDALGPSKALSLYHLRPHIRSMSGSSRQHEFCMADGTGLSDSTSLETYLGAELRKEQPGTELPVFTVYFQKVSSKPWFGAASQAMQDKHTVDTKPNLGFGDGVKDPKTAEQMRGKATNMADMGMSEKFLQSLAVQPPSKITYPSQLNEQEWDDILHNCNVFYGWRFDLSTLSISRAPYAAFKLRRGLNMPSPEIQPAIVTQTLGQPAQSNQLQNTMDTPKQSGTVDKNLAIKREGEGDKDLTVENSGGSLITKPALQKPNAIPTFRVSDDSRVDVSVVNSKMQESMARNNFTASSFEASASANIKGVDIGISGGKSERKEDKASSVSTQTEMTMIGNYRFPRVQLLLRSGDLEPTNELVAAIEEVKKTKSLDQLRSLHERFGHLFCEDLLLGGCLQTTRVIKGDDIATETATKSQFKAEVGAAVAAPKLGNFSTKYSTEKGDDQSQSSQKTHVSDRIVFEATGGNTVLVTNPPAWIVSIIEPQNWRVIERGNLKPLANVLAECAAPGVRGVHQWFVQAMPILSQYVKVPPSRSLLTRFRVMPQFPLQLSLFPDLEKSYYLGHEEKKPVHPIRVGLTRRTSQTTETRRQQGGTTSDGFLQALLPLAPGGALISRLTGGSKSHDTTIEIIRETVETKFTEEISLFTPARAQAPVILQYDDAIRKSSISLATHDETVWEMIVPHDDILRNNTQVMLRSRAGTDTKNQERYLTVYRTFQGTFLPGITSNEGGSIWRLVRDKALRPDAKDEYFQEGDLVRLCWNFADQTAGFRNFQLDTFGRRCYQRPVDIKFPTLYIKFPYPSFGATTQANSGDTTGRPMMLYENDTQLPFLAPVLINGIRDEGLLTTKVYHLHDISFRLDIVGNNGQGEILDYMTSTLSQEEVQTYKEELSRRVDVRRETIKAKSALEQGIDDAGHALFGMAFDLVTGPTKGIMSRVLGLFS